MLIVRSGVRPLAVAVEELVGKEDVVIKNLGGLLERVGPFAGATVTGDGRVILLVDPSRLADVEPLPPELQYRVLGTALILLDIDTALIVDVIPDAFQRSS